jgi:hypothetical protein
MLTELSLAQLPPVIAILLRTQSRCLFWWQAEAAVVRRSSREPGSCPCQTSRYVRAARRKFRARRGPPTATCWVGVYGEWPQKAEMHGDSPDDVVTGVIIGTVTGGVTRHERGHRRAGRSGQCGLRAGTGPLPVQHGCRCSRAPAVGVPGITPGRQSARTRDRLETRFPATMTPRAAGPHSQAPGALVRRRTPGPAPTGRTAAPRSP